jgi:hypothetical protein
MSDTPIFEIKIPATNTAADWNEAITEGAEKAGVELPVPGAAAVTVADIADKKGDETIYRATLAVGGKDMVIEGRDAADVLAKYATAVEASQLASAPVPAAAVVEEKKPALTDAEMFDVRTKLMTGDVTAIDDYILKSGLMDKYLESKGIKVDELKAASTERQSNSLADKWEQATKDFTAKVKAGQSDYPGGEQNTTLMGYMLAELGLRDKPSVESFEKAYEKLKERKLVFPVAAKNAAEIAAAAAAETDTTKKKDPLSSTAVGSHGGKNEEQNRQPAIDPNRRFEIDLKTRTVRESTEAYNELIRQGVKPEQIVYKQ